MRVKKISAFVLAMVLCLSPFTLFSFASDTHSVIDTGSPAVSMMAMRAIAADEGISLAAAEGNSGQFGYDIRPFEGDLNFNDVGTGSSTTRNYYSYFLNLPVGQYFIDFELSENMTNAGIVYYSGGSGSVLVSKTVNDNSASLVINVPSAGRFEVWGYNSSGFSSSVSSLDFKVNSLKPVEGISSGYTFNSGVKDDDDISARLEYVTWDFGSQPAGNYLINIYTYGQNYDVDFDIVVGSDITLDRKVAVSKSTGLYTCLISHGGGDLSLNANFTYKKSTLNSLDGGYGSISGDYGSVNVYSVSSGNWIFNITDVVAVPLASAGLEQFGVFGPLVGFLRDGFASVKSNVVSQFSQLKTSLTTEFNNLKTTITTQFTQLKTHLTTEFTNLKSTITTQFTQLKTHLTTEFTNLKSTITTQFTQLKTQLTNQYNGMKTFLEQQITRIVGDDDTENDVQDAADELNNEVQDLNNLSGQLDTQASNLEQQFTTDFAIPDTVSGQGTNFQSIYTSLFGSLGVFGIFIWLPIVMSVIKKLLRL